MVYSTRRFILCLTFCYFVIVFFSPFSITITSLGGGRASLCAFRTFIRFATVGFVFSLFLLVSGKGCGLWLWHSLDFSLNLVLVYQFNTLIITPKIIRKPLCQCEEIVCMSFLHHITIQFFLLNTLVHCSFNKRQKDCLWQQRTHCRSENGSLGFIETLHKR